MLSGSFLGSGHTIILNLLTALLMLTESVACKYCRTSNPNVCRETKVYRKDCAVSVTAKAMKFTLVICSYGTPTPLGKCHSHDNWHMMSPQH